MAQEEKVKLKPSTWISGISVLFVLGSLVAGGATSIQARPTEKEMNKAIFDTATNIEKMVIKTCAKKEDVASLPRRKDVQEMIRDYAAAKEQIAGMKAIQTGMKTSLSAIDKRLDRLETKIEMRFNQMETKIDRLLLARPSK